MATAVNEVPTKAAEYLQLPIAQVAPAPGFNNRRSLGDLAELAASIKSVGLLQPLLVRRVESALDRNVVGYFIIAGHRRHAAAKLAGLTHVDAKVVDQDEKERMESLLVENLHRLDIDPLEEAEGYKRLLAFGLKQQDIAAKVGRSPAHVSKRLSLLELPKEVHDLVGAGKMPIADAMELVSYANDPEVIMETLRAVKREGGRGFTISVYQEARRVKAQLEIDRKRAAAESKLKEERTSVLKSDGWGVGGSVVELGSGYGRLPIPAAEHKKSPCHAAWVDHDGGIRYVCTKVANHKDSKDKAIAKALNQMAPGRRPAGGTPSAAAVAKKAAASRERNKVLKVQEPLREAELKRLLTARQKKDQVFDFTLRQLLQRFLDESPSVAHLVAKLLELPMPSTKRNSWEQPKVDYAAYLSGGNDRLQRLAYAVALASGEYPYRQLIAKGYFDEEYSANSDRYMAHLKANGYEPNRVELAQLKPENKYRWRAPFDKPKGKENS